jgi:spore maturation protein CgeB
MFLNAPYDMLFFKDPYIVDIVRRKLGKCSYYLPECFSPRALQQRCLPDVAHHVIQSDICTAGNMYAFRAAFFENLADKQVKIWGLPAPRWLHLGSVESMMQNRWVANEEKAKAFLAAKIVLNNLNPAEIWGTNVRTFEICGAGAFQITDWRPGLSQLFDLERELVTFDDVADLRRKVDYYLGADKERRRIAEAGHQRAMRDHTYAHRLSLLLETVAGRKRGFPEPSIAWSEHVA